MKLRDDFHALIDKIADENALKAYYQLIQSLANKKEGEMWRELSAEQQNELLLSWEESFQDANLVSDSEIKSKYLKWL